MGEQGRDHGRAFPDRCQAGWKGVVLAKVIAASGLEVSNKNPKNLSAVLAGLWVRAQGGGNEMAR